MSEYAYDYAYDPTYCYPSSNVLKNRLHIRNAEDLLAAERSITALRILELKQAPPEGRLDFAYYKQLHAYIFQDIYPWAGKTRTVDIAKGTPFCHFQHIEEQAIALFTRLEGEIYLTNAKAPVAERLAFYLSELNAIHPFREGNGRTQRMFIEILADRAGYEVDFSDVSADEMIHASYQAFLRNYEDMNDIMRRITTAKD